MAFVIAGLDPGTRRLGLAKCDLVTGDPIACGSLPIDVPDGGWRYQQIGRALSEFMGDDEPSILAVEDPTHASRGKRQAHDWGAVLALIEAEAYRRWPHVEVWRISPPGWKKAIGLAGNAGREDYYAWCLWRGWDVTHPDDPRDYDAAAAAGVATWAWTVNQRGEVAA